MTIDFTPALKGTLETTPESAGIIATPAEAVAGIRNDRIMTPLRVQQYTSNLTFNFAPFNQAVPLTNNGTGWYLGKGSTTNDDFEWQQIITGGTVSSISIATANGFSGTSNADPSTPILTIATTLSSGQIPVSNGTGFQSAPTTGAGNIVLSTGATLVGPNLGTPATLVGTNITGTAAGLTAGNVTTNANLTGPITSVGNATAVASQTGTGSTFVMDTSPTLITPALGTPSALVATNATGTATGLTSGITNALKSATTTVDVSAATAPTSGQVLTATGGTAATWQTPATTGAPRVVATASTATLTPNAGTTDIAAVTAQAVNLTIAAPTGSPVDGQQLTIRIRDNGTTRTLTWNAAYVPFQSGQLAATTIINKTHYYVFWWNATTTVWELVTGDPVAGLWGA